MAHNGLVDYLAIGGLPYLTYGLLLIGSMVAAAVRIGRWRATVVDGERTAVFVWGLLALYLANLPFASGLAFHPAFCWIPPLLIVVRGRRQAAGPSIGRANGSGVT